MYKRFGNTHAILTGLLFAMVGFSFALATSYGCLEGAGVRATTGAVGSNLNFTNAVVSDANSTTDETTFVGGKADPVLGNFYDRDLGLVAVGSAFVRYATATGGVRPYTFAASNSAPLISTAFTGTGSLLVLSSGELVGTLGNMAYSASPLRFTIMVKDSLGTQPDQCTNVFRITMDNSGTFKFAVNSIAEGVQYQPYVGELAVINGHAPYTFSATVTGWTGTGTVKALEDVGFSLDTTNGIVYGKPFKAGTITFTANCTDHSGTKALDTTGTTTGQSIALTIVPNNIINSDVVATGISIKIGATGGKDSIKYSGILNLRGIAPANLAGATVTLQIGGYTSPSNTIGSTGKITVDAATKKAKTPALSGSINSNGQLKLSVANESIGTQMGTFTTSTTTVPMAVLVQITGSTSSAFSVASSEFLVFTDKTSSKGSSSLTYKISGVSDEGGDFLLTSVQGKDATSKSTLTNADSWKVGFIALPPGSASFGSPTLATVGVGSGYSNAIAVTETNGAVKSSKVTKADDIVLKLAMSAKNGKSSVQTSLLKASETGIPMAANATAATSFAMSVTLTGGTANGVGGADSMAIFFPSKNAKSWSSKIPK